MSGRESASGQLVSGVFPFNTGENSAEEAFSQVFETCRLAFHDRNRLRRENDQLQRQIHENEDLKAQLQRQIHENEDQLQRQIHENEDLKAQLQRQIHENEDLKAQLQRQIHENEGLKAQIDKVVPIVEELEARCDDNERKNKSVQQELKLVEYELRSRFAEGGPIIPQGGYAHGSNRKKRLTRGISRIGEERVKLKKRIKHLEFINQELELRVKDLSNQQLMKSNQQLKSTLHKRTEQLDELIVIIDDLKVKSDENDQRIEVQKNDLKVQQVFFAERTFLATLFTDTPLYTQQSVLELIPNFPKASKSLWILRKHQQNLEIITRPHIREIIRATCERGIVSKDVGRCAVNCLITYHDCANGFYKALLVSVGDAPEVLEKFLQIMMEKFHRDPLAFTWIQLWSEIRT